MAVSDWSLIFGPWSFSHFITRRPTCWRKWAGQWNARSVSRDTSLPIVSHQSSVLLSNQETIWTMQLGWASSLLVTTLLHWSLKFKDQRSKDKNQPLLVSCRRRGASGVLYSSSGPATESPGASICRPSSDHHSRIGELLLLLLCYSIHSRMPRPHLEGGLGPWRWFLRSTTRQSWYSQQIDKKKLITDNVFVQ